MARLPPSAVRAVAKYGLEAGIEDIEMGYQAASRGLAHYDDEIEVWVRKQLDLGPDDEFPEPAEDDPGDPVWLLYETASERSARARRGDPMLRKVFTIALFHQWERACCRLARSSHYLPRNDLPKLGISPEDEDGKRLTVLQHCANCAKHGPGDACKKLYELRPDLFPKATEPRLATEMSLSIDENVFNEFLETVQSVLKRI